MICREYLDNFSMIILRILLSTVNYQLSTIIFNSFCLIMNY